MHNLIQFYCYITTTFTQSVPLHLSVTVCGNPDIPNNSRLVVQDYYYSNLSAVVCDVGYAVSSGDAIRLCNSSGLWNGTKAVCSRRCLLNCLKYILRTEYD